MENSKSRKKVKTEDTNQTEWWGVEFELKLYTSSSK